MKCRVRYERSNGWSPWIECLDADVKEGFLVIGFNHRRAYVPAHVITGEVHVEYLDTEDDRDGEHWGGT